MNEETSPKNCEHNIARIKELEEEVKDLKMLKAQVENIAVTNYSMMRCVMDEQQLYLERIKEKTNKTIKIVYISIFILIGIIFVIINLHL